MSLSEKMVSDAGGEEVIDWLKVDDVKEFIRLLKEDIDKTNLNYEDVWDWKGNTPEDIVKILIDKLAGDELI